MSEDYSPIIVATNMGAVVDKIDSYLLGPDQGIVDRMFKGRELERSLRLGIEPYRPINERFVKPNEKTDELLHVDADLPLVKGPTDSTVTWNMKKKGCKIRLGCVDQVEMKVLETDPTGDRLERVMEEVQNTMRAQLFARMQNTLRNLTFDFAADAGNGAQNAASTLSSTLLTIRQKKAALADFLYVPNEFLVAIQSHPNLKEKTSHYVGTANVTRDVAKRYLADELNMTLDQIYVEDSPVEYDSVAEEFKYNNAGTGAFLYFGTWDHLRFYKHVCSDALTEKEEHGRKEYEWQRIWDLVLTEDKAGGCLVTNVIT